MNELRKFDSTNGCFCDHGMSITDKGVSVKYHTGELRISPILIESDGHFIGVAGFTGGVVFRTKHGDYDYHSFAIPVGNTVHHIQTVTGPPSIVEKSEIPYPFNRFKVGAEKLPSRLERKERTA